MSYYWFNRQEILQKAKERYSKEKAVEYYLKNKEDIKEKARDRHKKLSQDKIKETRLKTKTRQDKIKTRLKSIKKKIL